MEHLQNYLIVLVLILFFLQRLLKERAIKDTMKSEIIIVLVGLYLIISNWQEIIKTNHTLILIVLSVLLGFIFGVLRAQTVKIYQRQSDQQWVKKGTWLTVLVFIIGVIINRVSVLPFGESVPAFAETLHIGVSLLGAKAVYLKKVSTNQRINNTNQSQFFSYLAVPSDNFFESFFYEWNKTFLQQGEHVKR